MYLINDEIFTMTIKFIFMSYRYLVENIPLDILLVK